MLNTQELKATVSKLSAGDLNEFTEWFEEFIEGQLNNQIDAEKLSIIDVPYTADIIEERICYIDEKGHIREKTIIS